MVSNNDIHVITTPKFKLFILFSWQINQNHLSLQRKRHGGSRSPSACLRHTKEARTPCFLLEKLNTSQLFGKRFYAWHRLCTCKQRTGLLQARTFLFMSHTYLHIFLRLSLTTAVCQYGKHSFLTRTSARVLCTTGKGTLTLMHEFAYFCHNKNKRDG